MSARSLRCPHRVRVLTRGALPIVRDNYRINKFTSWRNAYNISTSAKWYRDTVVYHRGSYSLRPVTHCRARTSSLPLSVWLVSTALLYGANRASREIEAVEKSRVRLSRDRPGGRDEDEPDKRGEARTPRAVSSHRGATAVLSNAIVNNSFRRNTILTRPRMAREWTHRYRVSLANFCALITR